MTKLMRQNEKEQRKMDRDERNRYIQNDARYKQMLKAFCILEKQFDNTVGALPLEIQDIIWDYVSASNALRTPAVIPHP